jgi:hypothetical protein
MSGLSRQADRAPTHALLRLWATTLARRPPVHFARFEKFFAFSGLREFNRDRRSDMTNALVETWKLVVSSLERLTVRGHRLGSGPSKSASSKWTGK